MAQMSQLRHNKPIMPKQITDQELQLVVDAVRRFPSGASIELIFNEMGSLSRRTLQRRLAMLVDRGLLVCEGRGSATRYQLPVKTYLNKPAAKVFYIRESDSEIPLSPEGYELQKAVLQPLRLRTPVGYNRQFLDDYRPNQSFYLPEATRRHLAGLGGATQSNRPAGTYARHIFNRLLIDLSWNSSRLEGNTYSLLETERLLVMGASADGKDILETQMILNHKAAIELLVDQTDEVGFNRYTLLNLHSLLSENLLADPQACGRLRHCAVGISGTVFYPLEVPQQIEECFQQIIDTAAAIHDPFEQAFFVMVHLPYLQPFEDVNKRVSRLAANISLIRDNLSPLAFVDVPDKIYIDAILAVYEFNRIELLRDVFVWAYERSCARYSAVRQSLGEPDPFRFKYKKEIADLVSRIVRDKNNKTQATKRIRESAKVVVLDYEIHRFVEIIETELMALHEGNIARYKIRPGEYKDWLKTWY
jgi:Fic family protein